MLRPIVFVPSALKPVLFDQVEDLLKPGVEEVGTFFFSYFILYIYISIKQTDKLNIQMILNKAIFRLPPQYLGCSVAVSLKA